MCPPFPSATTDQLGLTSDAAALKAQGINPLAPEPILDYVGSLYEFAPSLFDELIFYRQGSKHIRCLQPPAPTFATPRLDRAGIDFLRIDMATPRLATPAALTWGRHARQNAIDLDQPLATAYLRRQPLALEANDIDHCTGRGFVIVRHRHHALGLGFLESTSSDDPGFGRLRSLYPKAYAQEVQSISPFGNPS